MMTIVFSTFSEEKAIQSNCTILHNSRMQYEWEILWLCYLVKASLASLHNNVCLGAGVLKLFFFAAMKNLHVIQWKETYMHCRCSKEYMQFKFFLLHNENFAFVGNTKNVNKKQKKKHLFHLISIQIVIRHDFLSLIKGLPFCFLGQCPFLVVSCIFFCNSEHKTRTANKAVFILFCYLAYLKHVPIC